MSYEGEEADKQQAAVEAALDADREKSLRDVFAATALGALLTADRARVGRDFQIDKPATTQLAYEWADAMLQARKPS